MSNYDEKNQAEKAKAKQGQPGQPNLQNKQTGQPGQPGQAGSGQREQDIRGKGREQGSQSRANEHEHGNSGSERGSFDR